MTYPYTKLMLDPRIAPKVAKGSPRPFAPGEYVVNPDRSWSSERTMTVSHPDLNNGAATNIPALWLIGGKPYEAKSEDEAVALALKSGLPWTSYGTLPEADKASADREAMWQTLKSPREAKGKESLYRTPQKAKIPPLLMKYMGAK